MADFNTIARPYAQAAFKLAREKNALAAWSDQLGALAAVVRDVQMQAILASPRLSPNQQRDLMLDLCGEYLDEGGKNFVALLAENRRLIALPDVAAQYEALRAAEEGTLQARLISAKPVDDALRDAVAEALGKRLKRKVSLQPEVDEALLGGAVIRAGDLVIDGSVRGRLNRLTTNLNR
ncbi:F0F1 ATP synthase subunit delta [Methylonatrum kenyense]|uniref:F0F1 ATP synthase subunit delta n=1 Tax=Methylonatrum kenyense TaxID=455253 RepID=UPI0020BF603C|nr:F0F1 ATP synthase subunit delta [Methylonatrum kenyense]MCK8515244.1 F0F1 ATP synthase subunit delta [Methylonatrum kenyense]